jgi:hypothetical protein
MMSPRSGTRPPLLSALPRRPRRNSLVPPGRLDNFGQVRFGGGAEAGEDIVVGGNRLLAAAERAPLVEERLGDLFAQRQEWTSGR